MLRTQIRQAREEGFTLIELLIVIIILGILAGLVVFGVGQFRGDAVKAACKSDWKNVQVAVEAYYAKNGTYPTDIAGAGTTTLVGAGLLKAAPSSTEYTIAYAPVAGPPASYTLTGKVGTADCTA